MTDNRNTILAVILSGLVLIAWQYFYNMPQMEKQRQQTADADRARQPLRRRQPRRARRGRARRSTAHSTAAGRHPAEGAGQRPVVSRDSRDCSRSPRVKIETPRISGSIALKGARIDDLSLTQYPRHRRSEVAARSCCSRRRGTAAPYYAEFGWVAAAGANSQDSRRRTPMWQQEGSSALTPTTPGHAEVRTMAKASTFTPHHLGRRPLSVHRSRTTSAISATRR